MEHDPLSELMAPAYAEALRLALRGNGATDIARALGIPNEAVAPLVRIAGEKLARLLDDGWDEPEE